MRRVTSIMFCLAACGVSLSAGAITVAQLQKEMAGKQKFTVIDIRDTKLFDQGHIPGAINIPASLCPLKRLPPLGQVVIYDDGLGFRGKAGLNSAAAALSAKAGITVDILAGGFAAWESAQGLTTRGAGIHRETFNYLTYAELAAADPGDVVLVDLRKPTPAVLKISGGLTDLAKEFPGRRVTSGTPAQLDGAPLVVLIDSVDGSAEAQARLLKVRGIRRYAILAGGELSIARKGRRGLARSGPRYDVPASVKNPPPAETAK